jgi:hypothetical protein
MTGPFDPASVGDQSFGGAGGPDKAKARRRGSTLFHTKWRESHIKLLEIEQKYPLLFKAITSLPWSFLHWWDDGITLSDAMFKGVKRSGPAYLITWLNENHIELSENSMMLVSALQFFHHFTTYDSLFEYLKTHNWGELQVDRSRLDSYEKQTQDEERQKRIEAQEKEIVCVARELGCNLEDLVPQNVKSHHQCGGILKQGFWLKSKDLVARCPKCGKMLHLSPSEVDKG